MGDLFSNLALGLAVALSLKNVVLCFLGCLIGTLIGVLPGVGPIATITMLLPITFGIDPIGALIMLAGIYYGAQYGGSTTAILVNIAGAVATLIIVVLATPLTRMALLFGPADYFALMVLGLMFAVVLARGSVVKAIAVILVGILLSTIGTDLESGEERLTFGWSEIADGIDVAVIAMGMFGFAEILRNLEATQVRDIVQAKIGKLLPDRDDFAQSAMPIVRGTFLGGLLGLLPGNGAVLGPFASYTLEKKLAKDPSRFGRGAIEGVAGPESANNAGAQTAFIPLLTLGIPPNAVMALMVGAMTIHGIIPGPQIMSKQPHLFWGMIVSMWVGNLMLLVINLPLIGLWVRFLKVPYRLMFPSIVVLCCIGIYSVNNSPFDVIMTAAFGLFGYALVK